MGSQFVDLNADGHTDILAATFDGSPAVAWGTEKGYTQPKHLLDKEGKRIIISYLWDYEQKKHLTDGHALGLEKGPNERCISALAFDWDNDGDYDLLLGSYEEGHLYLMPNEGSNAEPKYTGKISAIKAGDADFAIKAKMTAPKLVDMDGDGLMDIVAGSFGDSYGSGAGGAVYAYRNVGKVGAPAFAAPVTLVAPIAKGGTGPTGPNAGLYADLGDVDGDGDLDLVVGAYSMWKPETRKLTEEEEARVEEVRASLKEVNDKRGVIYQKANAARATVEDKDAGMVKYREVLDAHKAELNVLNQKYAELNKELNSLVPSDKRESFVWLYRNQQVKAKVVAKGEEAGKKAPSNAPAKAPDEASTR